MLINCDYCEKEFDKKPSQIKKSKNNFCSKKCCDKWKTGRKSKNNNKVEHECHECNQEIEVENYKFKQFLNGKIKNLLCDKNCLANWQRRNFKGKKSSEFNSVVKNCCFCKKEYTVPKSRENTSKFCSSKCHSDNRIEDYDVQCDYCNKIFLKKKAQIRNRNFCTRECSSKWNSEFNNSQVTIECLICSKSSLVQKSRSNTAKTCSRGCHNKWLSEYYANSKEGKRHLRNNGIKTIVNQKYSETKPERIFKEFLVHNNIEFIPQYLMYDKFIVDFYLPNKNMVIEVFGDYWHSNPLFYGDGEKRTKLTKRQIKQQRKDKSRKAYLETCGHKFYALWENDIYNNLDIITDFLIVKQ